MCRVAKEFPPESSSLPSEACSGVHASWIPRRDRQVNQELRQVYILLFRQRGHLASGAPGLHAVRHATFDRARATCANLLASSARARRRAQCRRPGRHTRQHLVRVPAHRSPREAAASARAASQNSACSHSAAHARGERTGSCSPSWLYTLGDARTCSSDLASALRIDCASPARRRAKGAVPLQASTLCKAAARHERCSHGSCDTSRIRACSRCSRAWLSSANLAATAWTSGVAGRPCGAAILEE